MLHVIGIIFHEVNSTLIETISHLKKEESNLILLHYDAKNDNDDVFFLRDKNVIMLEDRVSVEWGRFSQIEATLKLIEFSLLYEFKYFSLISGDDVLVKDYNSIKSLFNSNLEFIHFQNLNNNYVDPYQRVLINHFDFFFKREASLFIKLVKKISSLYYKLVVKVKKKNYLRSGGVPLYKGTNWFTLTRSSLSYISNYVKGNNEFYKLFENSFCADEVFFHSIIKTIPNINLYQSGQYNNCLRYIDWKTGPEYPRIFREEDFIMISNSDALFARKMPANLASKWYVYYF